MRRGLDLRIARTAALLTLGALAVHQLRYLLAFGSESGAVLHREGHDYLAEAIPVLLTVAVAMIAARLIAGAASVRSAGAVAGPPGRQALLYSGALLCVFWAQELAEGALSAGHPGGLAAIAANGAWIAVPLACLLGLAAAVAERLLDRAEASIAVVLAAVTRSSDLAEPAGPATRAQRSPLIALTLAFGFARRPPPRGTVV